MTAMTATDYTDPNDRTAPRGCEAPGCRETFVPSRRGPVRDYCSPRCRKRLQRERARRAAEAPSSLAVLAATVYGETLDEDETLPPRGALLGLSEDWGLDYGDEVRDLAVRENVGGLASLVEERPQGLTPNGHKRRTDVEDAPDDVQDPDPMGKRSDEPPHPRARLPRLPADLLQEADEDGLPYSVRNPKDDHPEDVL